MVVCAALNDSWIPAVSGAQIRLYYILHNFPMAGLSSCLPPGQKPSHKCKAEPKTRGELPTNPILSMQPFNISHLPSPSSPCLAYLLPDFAPCPPYARVSPARQGTSHVVCTAKAAGECLGHRKDQLFGGISLLWRAGAASSWLQFWDQQKLSVCYMGKQNPVLWVVRSHSLCSDENALEIQVRSLCLFPETGFYSHERHILLLPISCLARKCIPLFR